jgi:ABC-type glycerol-3-phosphate transport system substrate-binding protein
MAHNTKRSHSKRSVTTLLASAAAASLLLSACSSSSGPQASASAGAPATPVELRMVANITPTMTKAYYEDLVKPWLDQHKGVSITVEVPSQDVQTTVQQELASGDVPDVIASFLQPVVDPQLLAFPEEDWVLATPFADSNRVDGKVLSVGTSIQTQSLVYYNADAFAAARITKPPSSIDELTADLKALKAAGYLPLQTAGEWVTGNQFEDLAEPQLLHDDPQFWAHETGGSKSFAGSAFEGYMKAYAGWVADGLVASDALGFKYQDAIDNFTSGKAGMMIMGNWLTPSIDQAAKFSVGVIGVPSLDGSDIGLMGGYAQPYSIMKDSKHTELSLSLVKYLVSDEAAIQKALAIEGNYRPGVKYDGGTLYNKIAVLINAAKLSNHISNDIPTGFGDAVNKQVQLLYTGTAASDATAGLDSWWKANAK